MSQSDAKDYSQLILPPSVVTKLDMSRLLAEVEQLDVDMTSAQARVKVGVSSEVSTVQSGPLTDFLTANQISISDNQQRSQLIADLRQLKDKAPVVHITFATTADQDSLGQLADWLRQSVHRQCLVVVGLQPGLIGGAYVRTTNQVHDLSVRAQLAGSRHLLVEAVEAVNAGR